MAIDSLIEKICNQEIQAKKTDEVLKERKAAYIQALSAKVFDDKTAQLRYNSILNKLIRLKSRTSLLTFLNYIDPLPVDILNSISSLDKLLLLAFNEAVHMKTLTGDKEFLN